MKTLAPKADRESPYEIALAHALSDLNEAISQLRVAREKAAQWESRVVEFKRLVEILSKTIPASSKILVSEQLRDIQSNSKPSRAKAPHEKIVELFEKHPPREWETPDIQLALKAEGINIDGEQIHNILNYLFRKGRVNRIGRGRYVVVGYGIGIEGDPEGGYR